MTNKRTKRPSICQLIGHMVAKHNARLYTGPMSELIGLDPDLTLEEIETLIPIFEDALARITMMHHKSLDLSQQIGDTFRAREHACLAREDEQILKYSQGAIETLQKQLAEYPECASCGTRGEKNANRCPNCDALLPDAAERLVNLKKAMDKHFQDDCLNFCDDQKKRLEGGHVRFVNNALQAAEINPFVFVQVAHAKGFENFQMGPELRDEDYCDFGDAPCMNVEKFIIIANGAMV